MKLFDLFKRENTPGPDPAVILAAMDPLHDLLTSIDFKPQPDDPHRLVFNGPNRIYQATTIVAPHRVPRAVMTITCSDRNHFTPLWLSGLPGNSHYQMIRGTGVPEWHRARTFTAPCLAKTALGQQLVAYPDFRPFANRLRVPPPHIRRQDPPTERALMAAQVAPKGKDLKPPKPR